ncbi:MAG: hypothetical protein K6F00_11755 [Lachnospiraceae bacterium]|nr:hypothetical protein [Lachnospiraceae bacterium]
MSISPIAFNGMIQNTGEVSHTKASEEAKPALNQENISVNIEQKAEQSLHQVNETYASDEEGALDADGSNNGYSGTGKRKKKKKEEDKYESDGKVILKGSSSSFNITI